MAPPNRPRGSVPARVYWFRRALVLGTAIGLVVLIADLLGGGSSGSGQRAVVAAARPSATLTTPAAGVYGPVVSGSVRARATPTVLAQPDGPCAPGDLTATPTAGTASAGGQIALTVALTGIRPACTFQVSASTLVARITRGSTKIWSTQDCPQGVPSTTVVVRSAVPTPVVIGWNGRRSSSQCGLGAWALPGDYQLEASVIGSEPGAATISLGTPPRPVVTETVTPTPTAAPKATATKAPTAKAPTVKPTKRATPATGRVD